MINMRNGNKHPPEHCFDNLFPAASAVLLDWNWNRNTPLIIPAHLIWK